MKINVDGLEIETERNITGTLSIDIVSLANVIKCLSKEKKEKLMSLLSED